jgi:hypothetical protein
MKSDYYVELKVKDARTHQTLDEGKIYDEKGFDWLNKKYGLGTYMGAWLEITYDDLEKIWDKNPQELIDYVRNKLEQKNRQRK